MTAPTPRIVGEPFGDYDGFICALRARKDQLQLSSETVERLAGWAEGQCDKYLGPSQVKILGLATLEDALTVFAMKLMPIEDEDALRLMEKRYEKRDERMVRKKEHVPREHVQNAKDHRIAQTRAVQREALKLHLIKIGKKGSRIAAVNAKTSRSKRTRVRIGRYAAKIRWRRYRAAKRITRRATQQEPREPGA